MDRKMSTEKPAKNLTNNLSTNISNGIANFFYRLGYRVANSPWVTIGLSVAVVIVCAFGFFAFHTERNPLKLWIPQNSRFLLDTEWMMNTYKEGARLEQVLITAPNVFDPKVLKKLLVISKELNQATVELVDENDNGRIRNYQYSDVCLKIPIIAQAAKNIKLSKRKKREINEDDGSQIDPFGDDFFNAIDEDLNQTSTILTSSAKDRPFNPSVDLFSGLYCQIVNSFPMGCYLQNVLEMWDFNETVLDNLTLQNVIDTINTVNISATTGHQMEIETLLADIRRNESGAIIGAGSILTRWFLHVNFSEVDHEKHGNLAGTEDWATQKTLLWESKFLDVMKELAANLSTPEINIYYSAERSFGDISAASMFQSMDKVVIGVVLMFFFMQFVLSKFSWVELRLMLASLGLLSVGMAFVCACGICSLMGVKYGPVHTSLPFLLMGLGVDDIFVMMASWRKVQFKEVDIPEKIALMLRHAGASVTVTSVTDIAAFLIGSITVLPSLQSFCIYATVGIFMTYIFAITFFVAVFTLDEYRIMDKRNAVFPWIKHRETKICWEKNLMSRCINFIYGKFVLTKIGKCLIILLTICMTAFNVTNLLKLDQKFDPVWFVPSTTYLSKFIELRRTLYPDMGFEAGVYFGQLNYTQDFPKILNLSTELESANKYVHEVNSWAGKLQNFSITFMEKNLTNGQVTENEFANILSKFLFSPEGGKYQPYFRFKEKLACGEPTSQITISSIPFKFRRFVHRNEYLPAKRRIEELIEVTNITTGDKTVTAWSKIFGNWITDEIIDQELLRNISLAMLCVMICTVLLIMNPSVCFWIFNCVVLTLVNVCGMMHLWGLTIDLVSCIALQLAVGLCVDYAAHIGHTFLVTSHGSRNERALETMLHIGEAILYGGGSTLLGLAMLSFSDAYTFKAFFKIFLLVILYGLFHGVVVLPVILSIVGPPPYRNSFAQFSPRRNKSAQNKTDEPSEKPLNQTEEDIEINGMKH